LASTEVIRPAVMFGPDDAFLNTLIQLLRRLPVYPMFGRAWRDAAAARRRVYSYEELLKTIARAANVRRILVPVPFAAWHALARVAEMLPGAPVTCNQVELMQIDSVASPDVPGFTDLGISPRALEEILQSILNRA
jgi:hypothetical protein